MSDGWVDVITPENLLYTHLICRESDDTFWEPKRYFDEKPII